MEKTHTVFKYSKLTILIALLSLFITPSSTLSFELVGWHHGELGYEGGRRESIANEAPLMLFFYEDSDESSQRLKDEYLRSYEVYVFLNSIPKADLNLNGDRFEKAIAGRYKADNEPTLLVSFPFGDMEPVKITPFSDDGNMSTYEFIDHLKDLFVYVYSTIAYDAFEREEYENAARFFNYAIEYDPDRAYTHFALGSAYHGMAVEEKNMDLMNRAEESYLKALEIDPGFNECREELERLYENIDILRDGAGHKAQGSGRF